MIVLAALLMANAVTNPGTPITIEVHNVRNNHGHVLVAICPRERFLAESCPWHASEPARPGTTAVTVPGVPPGDYAVQVFQDENDNDRIDRALFGLGYPKEGVGFSRDVHIVMGPPKWQDTVFTHGPTPQTISLSLRYFMGPASPEEWKKKNRG